MPTTQAVSGCFNAPKAEGRNMKLANATAAPIANVIAASWNAGILPVATVRTDSSDHIRIAVSPIRVAVRGVIISSLRAERSNPFLLNSENGLLRRYRSLAQTLRVCRRQ